MVDRNLHSPARHCLEKAHQANRNLATGPGRINERLYDAFLVFGPLSPEHFPEGNARNTFSKFYQWITADGQVRASLNAMSEENAIKLAHLLLRLEYELEIETET